MKEQLISFETAKLAKEKGFLFKCENYWVTYNHNNKQVLNKTGWRDFSNNPKKFKNVFSTPTQSLLQKWLRDVHITEIYIKKHNSSYSFIELTIYDEIEDLNKIIDLNGLEWANFESYEEALEMGLLQALKLIE